MTLTRLPNNPLYDLLLLVLLLATLFGLGLGDRPYSSPSESRYVEIGREMAESGDFVTPRLNYVKYFEKPPLFYWIQAEATKLGKLNPLLARAPTALFTLLLCLLTYALGRILYDRPTGILSALVLGTTLYTFALSRIVLLDVPVSVFIVATLTSFIYVVNTPNSRARTLVLYVMYIAAACAVLTKGLIGAVLPGAVIFLWIALTKQWRLLGTLRIFSGTLLFLLIAMPWHILVSLRNPEFPHFYFIHEHLERYLTREHGRYQPVWFFAVVLIAGLFPWIAFTWQSLKTNLHGFWNNRIDDSKPLFVVIWIALILAFFSLSDSKLIPYILPIFPPITVLIGRYLSQAWQQKTPPGFSWGVWAMMGLLILIAILPSALAITLDPDSKALAALNQGGDDARYLSFVALIAGGLLMITYIQGRAKHLVLLMLVIAAVIIQMGDRVAVHYDKDSMNSFAGAIESLKKPGDEVVSYEHYYQDLPVYLGRRITIANWKGELEFGETHEDTSAWIIDDKEFMRRWFKDDHLMFAIMRNDAYLRLIHETPESVAHKLRADIQKESEDLHLYGLLQDGQNILFMNEVPKAPESSPETPKAP